MPKSKHFRDSVHGYISIPDAYCDYFIDTPIFQRIHEIDQTGMRVLFPCARHDRFSHSLGVYYLGRKAFYNFMINSKPAFTSIKNDLWLTYENSFLIACLLHDCAHSPFSHIFEWYYDYKCDSDQPSKLNELLINAIDDKDFRKDYIAREKRNLSPSPHEKASAYVAFSHYKEGINKCHANPYLIVRMILGCLHFAPENDEKRLENCLIELLNGSAIDVDKLDYILRDTWSSGVNNIMIDIDRLLFSLTVRSRDKKLSFKKQALNSIRSVIDGRNYLYKWIYGHHKIIYNQYLLEESLRKLAEIVCPDDSSTFLRALFSIESFEREIELSEKWKIYLPNDHDIIFLLKQYYKEIPEAEEYLFRCKHKVALWKTFEEFRYHFEDIGEEHRPEIYFVAEERLNKKWPQEVYTKRFVLCEVQPKLAGIKEGEILVQLDEEEFVPYTRLFGEYRTEKRYYFYLYVPKELLKYKGETIGELKKI